MKKLAIAVLFAALLVTGSPVFAQETQKQQTERSEHESEYYYVNVTLEKIYPYQAGYVVQYQKGLGQMKRAYLPIEWFTGAATKGEIITLPAGQTWPSLSVYYKEGAFSHVRLYVHRSHSHQTWGNIPLNVNLDSYFQDTDDFKL